MKRIVSLGVMALVVMSFAGLAFAAPDRVGRVDLGFNVSAALNDGDVDDTAYFGLNASYGIMPWLALGVSGGWQEGDLDNTQFPGDVGIANVMADIILRHQTPDSPYVPYAVLGLGGVGAYLDQENQNDDDDTTFGIKLGLGVDYFINDNWALNLEGAYVIADNDLRNDRNVVDGTDYATFGGGAKYVF